LRLPPAEPGKSSSARRREIERLFAELDVVAPLSGPSPRPGESPWTLCQLQAIALSHNPLIRQAAADMEAARGNMIQAGAYPNPHIGYQADTINTGRTGGYQGGNVSQTIVTGGKLRLAQSAAEVDLQNAELSLRRARFDLATQVRSNYLGVLVALERMKVNDALCKFANNVYQLQVKRVAAGQAAPYEPLQLRVLAVQAQSQLIQSNHSYEAAWRKLAITLNCPGMQPTALAGCIDGPVPILTYADASDRILRCHTDLVIAQNTVVRARYQLNLAQITPVCPNIDTSTTVEHDYTTPPFGTTVSLQIGAPLPIFDTNRGNIIAAEAALARASSEYDRARNDLLANLADTFARYETNYQTAKQYRGSILADQVRAYRGVYRHYQVDVDADFNDVITAQQTLASTISTYIQLLGDQWQAVADLAGLLQTDDIFGMGQPSVQDAH
jgi:cobalt-zinc-cadmium efflux system outer membrane protein